MAYSESLGAFHSKPQNAENASKRIIYLRRAHTQKEHATEQCTLGLQRQDSEISAESEGKVLRRHIGAIKAVTSKLSAKR